MKKLLLSLILAPIFVLLMAFKPTSMAVQFEAQSWENSKDRAVSEGKLYFVDFDANYCATCRNMDASTYMDQELADYMTMNVVALRVNVQDFDGVMWSQKYEVEALPTMLIFNEQGDLVKRLVGYKSSNDLMVEFSKARAVINNKTNASKVSPQPIAPDQPMSKVNNNALFNNKVSTSSSSTTTTKAVSSNSNSTTSAEDLMAPQGMGLYEVAVRKQESKGFGVQVGVFSSYESVLEQADKYKRKYSKKTLIHIDKYKGTIVYKLLLGAFSSRREASYFKNDLRRENIEGLVKDLKRMG